MDSKLHGNRRSGRHGDGRYIGGYGWGLMVRGMAAFDSACLAAYILGKAGERAVDQRGRFVAAPEVLRYVPFVVNEVIRGMRIDIQRKANDFPSLIGGQ